jgi:hypothetical protein
MISRLFWKIKNWLHTLITAKKSSIYPYRAKMSANGDLLIPLKADRGIRGIFTIAIYGNFSQGILSVFLVNDSLEIPFINENGEFKVLREKELFNIECNLDSDTKHFLKLSLKDAVTPQITLSVNRDY